MIELCLDETKVIAGGCSDEELDPVCLDEMIDEVLPCLEV